MLGLLTEKPQKLEWQREEELSRLRTQFQEREEASPLLEKIKHYLKAWRDFHHRSFSCRHSYQRRYKCDHKSHQISGQGSGK